MSIEDKTPAPMLQGVSEAGGPGRLQARENAYGLQQGGLALGVGADEDIHPGRELAGQRFEAPEMAQGEIGKHVAIHLPGKIRNPKPEIRNPWRKMQRV
jgi:hypothetical protein